MYRIASPIEQHRYLCNGLIKKWNGPQHEVLSPLCLITDDTVQQLRIGSFPLLTEQHALEALDAAGKAYNAGRSVWPTMPVRERIQHVEAFAFRMMAQRDAVVNRKGGIVNQTFMFPALLYPIAPGMQLYTEEQFGPVVPVVPFRDIEKPMNYVTQSNYGQQVSLFGRDPERLAELLDPLVNQVCRVNINSQCQRGPDTFPFTGKKSSAEGTLSVSDALRVFSIRTLVAANETDSNKGIINAIVTHIPHPLSQLRSFFGGGMPEQIRITHKQTIIGFATCCF
jgi:acyl-CoA reductase-like NAD-dependent aldehyde dehydrogenase